MPAAIIPFLPAIASGLGIAGNLFSNNQNAKATAKSNAQQQQYNLMMYALQRGHSVEDWNKQNAYNEQLWGRQNEYNQGLWNQQNAYNEKLWHQMNEYNSPMAQMQRFKEAGLNPNLIYGQSNMGGSISTANLESDKQNPSTPMRGANAPGFTPQTPRFNYDLQSGVMAYAAMREQSARTNNLEAQNDVLKQDAILRTVETSGKQLQNVKTGRELDMFNDLYQTSIDAAQANLRKITTETDLSLQRNEREAAANASNLREAAQRIMNMRGQNINAALDAQLKTMDIQLREMGINPQDPTWMRVLGRLIDKYSGKVENTLQLWNPWSK